MTKDEMLEHLSETGIEVPRLYRLGFSHNNCGGFCCRAGQGHFAKLLKELPEQFADAEAREDELRQFLGKDVAMMKKQRKGIISPYTLRQLREDIEAKHEIDSHDIGGCGCFVDEASG